MNKKLFTPGCLIAFTFSASVPAATYEVTTTSIEIVDTQGPVSSGTISSTTLEPLGAGIDFSGIASASAAADETGRAGVFTEGMFADGSNFELSSTALYQTSFTNDSTSSVNFTYEFLINGPSVEVADFAFVDPSSMLTAEASASIFMSTSGGASDAFSLSASLVGGRLDHTFTATGGPATLFNTDGGFGYLMDDYTGSFSGVLAAGETVTFDSELFALISGPGFELGGIASIGDPNNLSANPGLSSNLTVSAVPVPAAVWLFASGLIGLISVTRRRS